MDLFKKGTLKSQSLNSRFLASSNQQATQARNPLPVQPIPLILAEQPAASSAPSHQSSKLKLTTTKQTSAFRLNRDQAPSPAGTDQAQNPSKDVVDKKAPVWNKGMPLAKTSKDYTDEELKAMHGISLVSRSSNPGERKEGRWDDSDEDDDWGDTIDFGDGTKVVVAQVTQDPAIPTTTASTTTASTTTADTTQNSSTEPKSRTIENPTIRPTGNPWRQTDSVVPFDLANNQDVKIVPTNHLQSPVNERRPSMSHAEHHMYNSMRSPTQEYGYDQRSRSSSFNKDGRMQQSGDARYQYDQNTFDRRWHNPPPQTREIYNSSTGRLEQIDAAAHSKGLRRFSQNERRPQELLHKVSQDGNRSKIINPSDHGSESKDVVNGKTISKEVVEESSRDAAPAPLTVAEPTAKPLDPSSQEFLNMQKNLMASAREQAVQRRKEQEAEETARKDRAKKKAQELAMLAEKEAAEKAAAQTSKNGLQRSKQNEKSTSRSASAIEKNLSAQKGTVTAIQAAASRHKASQNEVDVAAPTSSSSTDLWQRGSKLPARSATLLVSETKVAEVPRLDSTHDVARTSEHRDRDFVSPSKNVWGPIGPKGSHGGRDDTQLLGSFKLDGELAKPGASASLPGSPSAQKRVQEAQGSPEWSAFDGISKVAAKSTEPREYNVYDAADEVLVSDRQRHSPPGQSQSNRTSSRFFPSATNAISLTMKATEKPRNNLPFTSPAIPPILDSAGHAHYEANDKLPALRLPSASTDVGPVNGIINGPKNEISGKNRMQQQNGPSRRGLRDHLETQTRNVWEVKQPKEGWAPRIRVPQTPKTLDWTRKEIAPSTEAAAEDLSVPTTKVSVNTSTQPLVPAWTLPQTLETTSKASNIAEPLIPPQPSLRLPENERGPLESPAKKGRKEPSRYEREKTNRLYTTRHSLTEEPDHMSPIRIKTSDENAINIARKFGKRHMESNTPKKVIDVKRQPVNMSDAPGGNGVKRGFTNRIRKLPPGLEAPPVILQRDHESSPAPLALTQGPPGISMPSESHE